MSDISLHWPASMLEHYLDVVFARSDEATLTLAMVYSLLAFGFMYVTFAGATQLMLTRASSDRFINTRGLQPHQVRSEILSSMVSILVFALLGGLTFVFLRIGWLKVTGSVSTVRWLIEVLILFLWNELRFYATHRMLHSKPLYTKVHIEHHRSVVVTPFAVYRFHWLEALMLGMVMPLAMVFHTFSIWSLMMLPPLSLWWNVIGHSNYQPHTFCFGWLAKASERHAEHHAKFRGNYGFALPLLDKWFGTSL